MGKYFARYKGYIVGTLSVNILSAIFNVVSFSVLMPILEILFETKHERYVFMAWDSGDMKDVAFNNLYYYSQVLVDTHGPATTLLLLGLALCVLTFFKTAAYFGGSACLMPLRTGIVRDIRNDIYKKVLHLPLAFFSEKRKGDILTRIT
jgi:ATP-binding cassette subfamily B protein/subfamily B ATP-binding cassette protein MsbA